MIKLLFQIKTFFSANNVYFIKNFFFFQKKFFFSNLVLQQRNSHSRTFSHLTFYIPLEVYIIIDHSWKLLTVAPRVEKTEVFNFASLTCFGSCIMKKRFFITEEGNGVFSLVFTMKSFSTALSYLTAHSTLNFSRTFLYF